ncbi:DUF6612 family protein [Desulfuribacillus alkaliarsenatis]|uniref:Copper amine oxidase-like N-terminal domain-containing protein n=1 Tax=Desulfuribacillus alkaliarsenatis TaxID=766136 RepID=A0A1E5G388_9FIRM|nr:DUF6612 family protein [Desulfuribacillus alkaliarsenatis]OEF97501.1 hypothetical protein BHF68_04660 [Desulfuribacillus alkaliarsenatis]
MRFTKKVVSICVIFMFILGTALPTGLAAEQQIQINFNGQSYNADFYLEDDITYINVDSLKKIPGLEVNEYNYVPLRAFFEGQGATVTWNAQSKVIDISWRETNDGWTANDLVVKAEEVLKEYNTYRMAGDGTIDISISGNDAADAFPFDGMTLAIEGSFSQEPLAMYMKQTMTMPINFEEMGLTEEELALMGMDTSMVTEMVWKDNAIYQRILPLQEQWIVNNIEDLGMSDTFNDLLQMTPQQNLELMTKYGVFYTFGDDVEVDGIEYYVVNSTLSADTFRNLMEDMFDDLMPPELLTEESDEVSVMIDEIFANINMNFYQQTLINKETLTTDFLIYDMVMSLALADMFSQEDGLQEDAPESMLMSMSGVYHLYDFGVEIELPDVSDAITQEEYMEQQMQLFESLEPEVQ